ncbi:MAG: hypothetical protein AAF447_13625, partial [Myxococcota bacterium]
EAMLAGLALAARVTVVVAPRRRGPMVQLEDARVELAGAHARLRALQAARLASDPRAESALRLLALHVVGYLEEEGTVSRAMHLAALRALMTP